MWMELQGKKAITHDFLSLYKDPSSQDSKPPPQESLLKTHDFLQPLEKRGVGSGGARGAGDAPPARVDIKLPAAPEAAAGKLPDAAQAARPSGFCTYSVSHRTSYNAPARPVGVRPDWFTCALPSPGASGADRKADSSMPGRVVAGAEVPAWGGASTATVRGEPHAAGAFALWEESALPRDRVLAGRGTQQQWPPSPSPSPSPFPTAQGGSNGSSPCVSSSRPQLSWEARPAMASEAKSNNRSMADEDEDEDDEEELVVKRETPSRKELTVKIDGGRSNRNCNDQKASTPRSKHSETEQRRRSKINDRFRILRDLIPHSDQKRDKASLLLEAIEYVQFLQEKVQKYESLYPGWNQDNTKLTPWKISQAPGESMVNPSHIAKHGPASSGFTFPAESTIPGAPTVASNSQVVAESENVCSGLASKSASVSFPMPCPIGAGSEISQLQQRLISDSENVARHEAHWLRPCAMESSVSSDILSGEEELAIDKGTISLSSRYSEGLLTTLTQALRSSGVDLSQASISVQINLGRHAMKRTISNTKDQDGDGLEQAKRRHKSDNS